MTEFGARRIRQAGNRRDVDCDPLRAGEKNPYFGICLGMQTACIEFARNVVGLAEANSSEFDPATPHRVIYKLRELRGVEELGGTMRLGAWPCKIEPNTLAHRIYGKLEISERHRHRYEFNREYEEPMTAAGLRISGSTPDGTYVEMANRGTILILSGASSSRVQVETVGAASAVQHVCGSGVRVRIEAARGKGNGGGGDVPSAGKGESMPEAARVGRDFSFLSSVSIRADPWPTFWMHLLFKSARFTSGLGICF